MNFSHCIISNTKRKDVVKSCDQRSGLLVACDTGY